MQRKVIGQIRLSALYFSEDKERYEGWIRLKVSKHLPGTKGRFIDHPKYPSIYVPSGIEDGEIYFLRTKAIGEREKTLLDGYGRKTKEYWDLSKTRYSHQERDMLGGIFFRLGESLDTIAESLIPMKDKNKASRRGFLSHYPNKFWIKRDLSQTLISDNRNKLTVSIAEQDLPSYDGGKVKTKVPLDRKIMMQYGPK